MNSPTPQSASSQLPRFATGIPHTAAAWPDFDQLAATAVIAEGSSAISDITDPAAIYQTQLTADALRYLTLLICASKASGHPGGFASSADAYAALALLGHTNILTEVGHHAPGFYSAMFLDGSLEAMGINTVTELRERFREQHGLLGHLSGAIPGLLAPAGPLGQGQHFALAGALRHRDKLFPFTIGDGGLGEPYVMSAMQHFHTAWPEVTNFLPVLVWNGYSQEHHAMVSRFSNAQMESYWRAHGFSEVVLIDAKAFDDANQEGAYVDSTQFSWGQRQAFTAAVLAGAKRAADAALQGTLSVLIIKQLKGSGVHRHGSKSHNLYPGDTLDAEPIAEALVRRSLPATGWQIVRDNLQRAGGGRAVDSVVTELATLPAALPPLPLQSLAIGEKHVPSTTFDALVAAVGQADADFIVTNADGNEASGMANINHALAIRHPTRDDLYHQRPDGQVYEPLNEDACAGLASALALFGSRALWISYESFAINGLPIMQTVLQAMAELRRQTPSMVAMFTAGALEQGRNGWTHQRPEIENYFAALIRNGNVYPLFPCDANQIQVCYDWALQSHNKGIAIFASKSPLPIYSSHEQARQALDEGAVTLYESGAGEGPLVVLTANGDMVFLPLFEARDQLEANGWRVRIVAVVNPRRLYRPQDVAWSTVSEPDDRFLDDAGFERLFGGDLLLAVSGGPSGCLEPVLLRSRAPRRDLFAWQRGETTASPAAVMAFNGLTAEALVARAEALRD